MSYITCNACNNGRHYACINGRIITQDLKWCRCDTCAQICKDAEDDKEDCFEEEESKEE